MYGDLYHSYGVINLFPFLDWLLNVRTYSAILMTVHRSLVVEQPLNKYRNYSSVLSSHRP
jgi:hypothetical protein